GVSHLSKIRTLWQVEQDNSIPNNSLTAISAFCIKHVILNINAVKFKRSSKSGMFLYTQRNVFQIIEEFYFFTVGIDTNRIFHASLEPAVRPSMGCYMNHRVMLFIAIVRPVHIISIRRFTPRG